MPEGSPVDPVAAAEALGASVLAQIVSRTPDGVTLVDEQHRWIYANAAACRIAGRPLDELRGTDFLDSVPAPDRSFYLEKFTDQLTGTAAVFTGPIGSPGDVERDMIYSTFAVDGQSGREAVAVFRDISDARAATRKAVALAQTVSQLVGTTPANEILADIAKQTVESTRAVGSGIAVTDDEGRLAFGGGFGPGGRTVLDEAGSWTDKLQPGHDVVAVLTGGAITSGGPAGNAVVLADARETWETHPLTASYMQALDSVDWQNALCVPIAWAGRVIGVMRMYLPTGMIGPSETELAFCTALADFAAVAVVNARSSAEAEHAAALRERSRLARELHDSVSQTLFSMTMHSRAAELSLQGSPGADASLTRLVAQLAELARGTLAEMRALIFELRPDALSEEGLIGALQKQGAALAAREQMPIDITPPGEKLELDADVEEHVYRIVLEAMNNVVKHAFANHIAVDLRIVPGALRVRVTDDGIGFDPTEARAGHLGLSTMAQRAASIGSSLVVTSDAGTTVAFDVPLSTSAAEEVEPDARRPS